MSYSIKLSPLAKTDVQDIIAYYNENKNGLGTRFFNSLAVTFKLIAKNPLLFQIRYRNTHSVLIQKFPIQVHYLVDEVNKNVIVIAVSHTSRNPQIWKERGG